MQIEWFVYHKNSVLGPYTTDDVHQLIDDGKVNQDSFIWWKGEKDWIPLLQWSDNYESIVEKLEFHFNSEWRVKINEQATDFMSFDQCIDHIKNVELKNEIFIMQKENGQWESIFTNSIFLNALEMGRRQFPRVPIVATAKISKAGSKFSYLVKVNIIGQGGIGISGLGKNFPTGTTVDIKLESPSLNDIVSAEGKILYHTKEGITGIEFESINAEHKSVVIDYINHFEKAKNEIIGSGAA